MARLLTANETTSNTTDLYSTVTPNTAGVYLAAPNTRMILDVNAQNQPQPQLVDLGGFTMTIEGQTAYSLKGFLSTNNNSEVTITDSIVYFSGNRLAGNTNPVPAVDSDGEVLIRNTGSGISRNQFNTGTLNFVRCQVFFQNEGITIWPANTNFNLLGYVLNATDTDFYANEGPVTFHGRGARGSLGAAAIVLTRCRFFGNFTFNQPLAADFYGTTIPDNQANSFDGRAVSFQSVTDTSRWIVFGDAVIQWNRPSGIFAYDINGNHYSQSTPRAALFIGESTIFTGSNASRVGISNYVGGANNSASYASRMFGWNPRFLSGDTTTEIADIKLRFPLTDVDPNPIEADRDASWTDEVFRPWPSKTAIPAAIAVAPDSTDPAVPDANVVTHGGIVNNGYWWQVYQANGIGTAGAAPTTATSVPTAINTARTVQVYSYTHNADPVTSRHDNLDATGFTRTNDHSLTEDTELNGRDYTSARNLPAVTRENDVRPAFKVNNYDNNKLHPQTTNSNSQTYGAAITGVTYATNTSSQLGTAVVEANGIVTVNIGSGRTTFGLDDKEISGSALSSITLPSGVTFSNGTLTTIDTGSINVGNAVLSNVTVNTNGLTNIAGGGIDDSTINFMGTRSTTVLPAGSYDNLVLTGSATLHLESTGGTYVFSNGTAFGSGIALNRPAGDTGTVNVSLTGSATVDSVFGGQSRVPSFINIETAPIINTINIPAIENGFYRIDATRSGTTTQFRGTTPIVQNSDINIMIDDDGADAFTAGDTVTVYVKYNSTVSTTQGQSRIYREVVQTLTYTSSPNMVLPFTLTGRVVSELVPDITAPSNNITATVTDNSGDALVVITNTADAALNISIEEGQGLAAIICNDEDYFNAWYNNRATSTNPLVSYGQGNLTTFSLTELLFQSGNTLTNAQGTFRRVHIIQNWSAVTASERSGTPEIQGQVSELALIDASQLAESLNRATVVQGINTNSRDSANRLRYYITQDGPGQAAGIIPKASQYDNDTDYT